MRAMSIKHCVHDPTDAAGDGSTDCDVLACTDVLNVQKIIINVNKRVYCGKITNVSKRS